MDDTHDRLGGASPERDAEKREQVVQKGSRVVRVRRVALLT